MRPREGAVMELVGPFMGVGLWLLGHVRDVQQAQRWVRRTVSERPAGGPSVAVGGHRQSRVFSPYPGPGEG